VTGKNSLSWDITPCSSVELRLWYGVASWLLFSLVLWVLSGLLCKPIYEPRFPQRTLSVCLSYSSTLKKTVIPVCSSETSVELYRTTHHFPEDHNFYCHSVETIKSSMLILCSFDEQLLLLFFIGVTPDMCIRRWACLRSPRVVKWRIHRHSSEHVATDAEKTLYCFIYLELGPTITNQNLIQEEIKRRLNSGNACHHSVQNLLSSRLLPKNIKIRIYKIIILPVVVYGCETWSLTLMEEHRLRVFENRVLRRIFGPKRN
jgi:hypothetical protein